MLLTTAVSSDTGRFRDGVGVKKQTKKKQHRLRTIS